MTKIIDNLFLGDIHDSKSESFDVIINLSTIDLYFTDVKKGKCIIFNIPIVDTETFQIEKYFDYIFCLIELSILQKYKTLVNCRMGISRSTSFVIMFIMRKYNFSYIDAFDFVKKKRKIINPNYGFEKKLIKYSYEI